MDRQTMVKELRRLWLKHNISIPFVLMKRFLLKPTPIRFLRLMHYFCMQNFLQLNSLLNYDFHGSKDNELPYSFSIKKEKGKTRMFFRLELGEYEMLFDFTIDNLYWFSFQMWRDGKSVYTYEENMRGGKHGADA